MITLSDVTEFIRNGASIKQEKGCGGLPITRIETISNNIFNYDKMGYADINDDKYKDYYLKNYDVLLSHINSVKYLGRAVIYKQIDENPIIHGMNLLCLRFDLQKYNPEFFCYYSRSNIAKMYIANNTKKSVNQASITATAIKNMPIPDLSLELQSSIVDRLNKLQNIIELKNEQISKLDELVKSRFVEMFGDLKINSKGWEIFSFAELSEIITDGEHATPNRTTEGIYLLSARNVLNHAIQLDDVDYISQEEYDRISRRIIPQAGDVLISCSGSVGRCCSVPEGLKFQMVRSTALIRFKKMILPIFAEYMITSDFVQEQIESSKTISSQANLFQGKIAKLKGFAPPVELQKTFITFVKQTDKSKLAVQKSIKKLEILKKSLMQEYFG